jgi:hypothetical protein
MTTVILHAAFDAVIVVGPLALIAFVASTWGLSK